MPNTPLVNGINYSWANVTCVLFGVPVKGITKIEYRKKQKKENQYGFGQEPISRGYSNSEYEGTLELYVDEWRAIIQAAPGKDALQIAPFDIQIVFGGSRVTASTDILQQVEFLEDPLSTSQGDSKILVSIPLIIGGILHQ